MMYTNDDGKILYLIIEITQLLHQHNCTYNDTETILAILNDTIKQQREELEYRSIDDFIKGYKFHIADNDIIQPLNHVDGVC